MLGFWGWNKIETAISVNDCDRRSSANIKKSAHPVLPIKIVYSITNVSKSFFWLYLNNLQII